MPQLQLLTFNYQLSTFNYSSPVLGELTLEASAEGKLACIMPCKEEEDKVKVSEGRRG